MLDVFDNIEFESAKNKFTVEIDLMYVDKKLHSSVLFLGNIVDVTFLMISIYYIILFSNTKVDKKEEIDFYLKKLYDSTNFSNPNFEEKLR